MKLLIKLSILILFTQLSIASPELEPKQIMFLEIVDKLQCPKCGDLSVLESDHYIAIDFRQKIKQLIESGLTQGEILKYFVERFGQSVLKEDCCEIEDKLSEKVQ